jgi:hypothetical protein
MRRWLAVFPVAWLACSSGNSFTDAGVDATKDSDGSDDVAQLVDVQFQDVGPDVSPDAPVCPPPPPIDGGLAATLAPPFQKDYALYDLGPPPGVPDPLGGCTIDWKDDDTLLIAGASEDTTSALYSIKILRDACKHIIGWNGSATLVAHAPYMDANLVYLGTQGDGGTGPLMLYTEWPNATLGQLLPTDTTPSRETDLSQIGLIAQGSLGGLGIVLQGNQAGELRGVTYPVYGSISEWHHIQIAADGQLVKITGVTPTLKLCDGCGAGGFAYVPPGSPDFASASVLVAEWISSTPSRVSGYTIDGSGDPIVSSRFDFITNFVAPYGAYFDRVSGDYVFLQWQFTFNQTPDHVLVVRGFNKPPAPPPPPN